MSKLKKLSSSSEFVTLRIKKDTMSALKEAKLSYELSWPDENVTYDTVLVRLLESGVKRLDPEVHRLRESIRRTIEDAKNPKGVLEDEIPPVQEVQESSSEDIAVQNLELSKNNDDTSTTGTEANESVFEYLKDQPSPASQKRLDEITVHFAPTGSEYELTDAEKELCKYEKYESLIVYTAEEIIMDYHKKFNKATDPDSQEEIKRELEAYIEKLRRNKEVAEAEKKARQEYIESFRMNEEAVKQWQADKDRQDEIREEIRELAKNCDDGQQLGNIYAGNGEFMYRLIKNKSVRQIENVVTEKKIPMHKLQAEGFSLFRYREE